MQNWHGPRKQNGWLFLALAAQCTLLLFDFGDFTGYVGNPAWDVIVTFPSLQLRLLYACSVAVAFAGFTMIMLAASSLFITRLYALRLFLVLTLGYAIVVYYFGPFKELLSGDILFYELPRGPLRLGVSSLCASVLACITGSFVLVVREMGEFFHPDQLFKE